MRDEPISLDLDLSDPSRAERQLAAANALLSEKAEVPEPVLNLVDSLATTLADAEPGASAYGGADSYVLATLQRAALGAKLALDLRDPERRRCLRIRLEQMRQVFRDLAADAPVGDQHSAKEIARWLAETVTVPQQRLADLLGVERRTFQRWISVRDNLSPDGQDELRLRVVARLVNQLRHALTPNGVMVWFERERGELGGTAPVSLLSDPDALPRLQALAAGARSQTGA